MESIVTEWLAWMIPMSWQIGVLAGVIWLVSLVFRKASAEFLALVWLLVFVRLVLPPTLSAPWSISDLAGSLLPNTILAEPFELQEFQMAHVGSASVSTQPVVSQSAVIDWSTIGSTAFVLWLAVTISLCLIVGVQYWKYWRGVRKNLSSPSPKLQTLFECQLDRMGMPNTILLRSSKVVNSPGVFGVNVPIVPLPSGSEEKYDSDSLSDIISHELAHIQRRDLIVGFVVSLLACAYWFHPVIWFSLVQYRRNRELACDEMALRVTKGDGLGFAKTILQVAEKSRHPLPLSVGFLGILEQSDNLVRRVRAAQSNRPVRSMSNLGLVAILAMTALLLPMGNWNSTTTTESKAGSTAPKVVSTVPAIGAKDVDPSTTEVKVTFDQDMMGGFSWTGGGDIFPKVASKPKWVDKRTCVLPVELESGKYYRLGINASSFGNFRGVNKRSAQLNVLYFTTKGADEPEIPYTGTPEIVELIPANGATDVVANLDTISVRFNVPIQSGMSVTDQAPKFAGDTKWSEDMMMLTIPVSLLEGHNYKFGLNSRSFRNFIDENGVELTPMIWEFSTLTADGSPAPADGPPQVVSLDPPNGGGWSKSSHVYSHHKFRCAYARRFLVDRTDSGNCGKTSMVFR